MATVRDVANAARVSTASVSRVLAGSDGVSSAIQDRVRTAARELGYRPNAIARSLRTAGTQTIGLVLSDLMNPFFAELARSVEQAARQKGYSVIIGNADEDAAQQDQYIRVLLERQVDGLIVVPTGETSELLYDAAEEGTALILVDRPAPNVHAPVARASGESAIRTLVAHLIAKGYSRLGAIAGPLSAGTGRERLEELQAAADDLGIGLTSDCIYRGDFRTPSGRVGVGHLLDLAHPPDVVFAANGQMGQGAVEELRRRHLSWPEDIGICVFDDLPWFDFVYPGITAISQPVSVIGSLAVEMLFKRFAGEPVTDSTAECTLHVRGSCREAGDRS